MEDFSIENKQQRVNEKIRVSPVRVIASDGKQLGILSTEGALKIAQNEGMDLVEVASDSDPPVCRIMDFGKLKYRLKKRKGNTHQSKIKEIRVRPKIGAHDIDFKVKRAVEFIKHKDKVLITVIFRGREMAHVDEGRRVIDRIIDQLEEFAKVEDPPKQLGRRMVCVLAPK